MFNLKLTSFLSTAECTYFPLHVIGHDPRPVPTRSASVRKEHEDFYKKYKDIPNPPHEILSAPFLDNHGYWEKISCEFAPLSPEEIEHRHSESVRCSISRTKKRIRQICSSFVPSFFCTFTFNPAIVDRYCYDSCVSAMRSFLKSLPDDLQYIIVPERHKDGAFHFHGLFSALLPVTYAGFFHNQHVFHATYWYWGFTDCTLITDVRKVSSYLLKYIEKDLVEATVCKQRFIYSRSTISDSHGKSVSFLIPDESWSEIVKLLIKYNIKLFDSSSTEHPNIIPFCRFTCDNDSAFFSDLLGLLKELSIGFEDFDTGSFIPFVKEVG